MSQIKQLLLLKKNRGGTFDSDIPGTFESDTGGTLKVMLSKRRINEAKKK